MLLMGDEVRRTQQGNNNAYSQDSELSWFDWDDAARHAGMLRFTRDRAPYHVLLNAYWEPLEFELPPASDGARGPWRRWIDTSLDSPHDIVDWALAPLVPGGTYRAESRSVVVLLGAHDSNGSS